MKPVIAIFLCAVIPVVIFASETSYNVKYDGGSVADIKTGTDLKLFIGSESIRFLKGKETVLTIPSASITDFSYGQDVHRRVGAAIGLAMVSFGIGALMALTKACLERKP